MMDKSKSNPVWFYWGNKEMSFLRWMSLASACHFNEDVRLVIRTGETTGQGPGWVEGPDIAPACHTLESLDHLPNLTIISLEDKFPEVASIRAPEVQTSDLLAWLILATEGGWIADMDILFTKPVPEVLPEVGLIKFSGLPKAGYIPVSFMGGKPGLFWLDCWGEALSEYNPRIYESCGNMVFDSQQLDEVEWLPENLVFPLAGVPWADYKRIMWAEDWDGELPESTIGIHWYAGVNQSFHRDFDLDTCPGMVGVVARRVYNSITRRAHNESLSL